MQQRTASKLVTGMGFVFLFSPWTLLFLGGGSPHQFLRMYPVYGNFIVFILFILPLIGTLMLVQRQKETEKQLMVFALLLPYIALMFIALLMALDY